jgi:glycosyltransferase involved in cell wall biosynthesis
MRILFIAPLPPPTTGQSVAVEAFLSKLKSDGYDVLTLNMSKNTFQQGVNSFGRFIEIFRLMIIILKSGNNFDRVYLTTSESVAGNLKDMVLLAALGRLRSRTWLHLHGGAGMRNILSDPLSIIGRLNAFFLKRVAGVIVLGKRLEPIYEKYIPSANIRIVKNFAPDDVFVSNDLLHNKWSDISVMRILFLSNLIPGKGYKELLQAIKLLSRELSSRIRVDFAGGFETCVDEKWFREEIKNLPSVYYHGVVHGEVKKSLLANAHIFCLPTYYPFEGQPITILEAYASGCAVLTTDHSGIFDIFSPSMNGWEVQSKSPISIVDALVEIFSSPAVAAGIGKFNHQLAYTKYTRLAHLKSLYTAVGLT